MGYKITELQSLATTPSLSDLLPIVDVSDTTQSPNGSTKKTTALNFATLVGTGDTGVQGDTGTQGDTGIQGDTGDFLAKGDTGATGVQGALGNTGVQGAKGDTGSTGSKGDTGVSGNTGVTGASGTPGAKGDTGTTGDKGDTGTHGDTGVGVQGDTGAPSTVKGDTGAKGDTGVQGSTGIAGAGVAWQGDWSGAVTYAENDGVSYLGTAYISNTGSNLANPPNTEPEWDVWVEKGDTGTAGTNGAQGDTGITGSQGLQGDDGDTGVKGDTGTQGNTGVAGNTGVQGDTGATGATGAKGDTGNNGAKGDTGSSGNTGVTGDTGTQGDTGVGSAYWTDVPGTPTRVSDTQFTITDTSNADLYDLLFKKGTILKWLESTTFQTAQVISSSYSSDAVTINIVGDSLTAGFTEMKYCILQAKMISGTPFTIVGNFPSAATTNISKSFTLDEPYYILSADLTVDTAGSGTGSTVVDINLDGTTKFTTKPTLTTTGTSDLDNVADNPSTVVAAGVKVTIDGDSVTATTAPADGYVKVWGYPASWRYR